jgi:hypothetical protein
MSKKVDKLVEEIAAAKDLASKGPADFSWNIRAGMEVQIIEAKEKLPGLYQELGLVTFPNRVIACFAEGPSQKVDEVGAFMANERGIVVDASALYVRIAALVGPSFGQDRAFRSTQFHLALQGLVAEARELGIASVLPPNHVETTCPTFEDVVLRVRDFVHASVGNDALIRDIKRVALDAVVQNGLTEKRVPVIIKNALEPDKIGLASIFTRAGTFSFGDDFEVSRENILQAFKSLQ